MEAARARIQRILDKGRMVDITNMNDKGQDIVVVNNTNRSVFHYYVGVLDVRSRNLDKIKLLFKIFHPEYRFEAIEFALNYEEYEYLSELIDADLKDYDFLYELVNYALDIKNHKFLAIIISKDLPVSLYERAYQTAHKHQDNKAKDMIWDAIAQQTLLRFEVIDRETVPELRNRY